jgi:GDP-4-dehydro-6-deoxy-D-mannose reductase
MRVLVTGISGFVGSHFAELALAEGAEVYGSSRWRSNLENIEHLRDRIHLVESDMRDLSSMQRLLDVVQPDAVLHLAGQTFVAASWQAPVETLATNVLGQANLLEAARARSHPPPRLLVAGSSEEYGLVHEDELPVRETNPLRPLSPYAVSKVAQDVMAFQYFHSYRLPIIRSRAFNHEGPRRADVFVTSSFARQIAEIERGEREPVVRVGNLKARRDFTDVRDIVRGYWRLLQNGVPGEVYNLCSGRAWAIQEILDFLLAEASVSNIEVREDPDRLRPSDVAVLVGDASKVRAAVGWTPTIPFEQTLRDMLAYWRAKVAGAAARAARPAPDAGAGP